MSRASSKDPMTRYLMTAERVNIGGSFQHDCTFISAVTLGDRLYVSQQLIPTKDPTGSPFRLFVLDMDDSRVRHKDLRQRQITFFNRRQIKINGIRSSNEFNPTLLIPCSRSKCLYVVENDHCLSASVIIHKLKSDGSPLLRFNTNISWITSLSLDPAGAFLAFVNYEGDAASVHCARTGALVSKVSAGDENDHEVISHRIGTKDKVYLNERRMDVVYEPLWSGHPGNAWNKSKSTLDDRGCLLLLTSSKITVEDIDTRRHREIKCATWPDTEVDHFYDKARGLVFCNAYPALIVYRITR